MTVEYNFEVEFNIPQYKAYYSEAPETFLIGGVGLGKSFFLAYRLYEALSQPGAVCGVFAPTNGVLQKATLPQIRECWDKLGFTQDYYVINKQPPKNWNVQPFSLKSAHKILTTRFGSYCILDGLENFDAQRGTAFDEIFVDELRDVKDGAREVLLGRLRGKLYKETGQMHRIWYATTPPDNDFLKNLAEKNLPTTAFYFGSSYENSQNLPTSYLDNLKSTYDDITFQREIMADWSARSKDNLFCYAFDETRHIQKLQIQENQPLYLSFDFNVNPMTCIVAQHNNKPANIRDINILDEFRISDSNIYELCDRIKQKYGKYRIIVTGDAAGMSRSVMAKGNLTAYHVIMTELNLTKADIRVPSSNPPINSSFILTNSILQNHQNLKFDFSCKHLIIDMQSVKMLDDGSIDKKTDPQKGHLLDCLRYYFNSFHSDFVRTVTRRQ